MDQNQGQFNTSMPLSEMPKTMPMNAPTSMPLNMPTSMPPIRPETGSTPTSEMEPLPEMNRPMSGDDGGKKQLLQRLLSNLLNKPGRSMHEIINGVKSAIGAYKNYAKEWDNLNASMKGLPGNMSNSIPTTNSVGSSRGVQDIIRGIQEKKSKDGGGGPGINMPSSMAQAPNMVVPQTMTPSSTGPSPIQQMPQLPPTNVPPTNVQRDDYKSPPPVSSLGMWGF